MGKNTGTLVIASVRPYTSDDTFASALSNEIMGGHHQASGVVDMYAIPSGRRQEGMLCWIKDSNTMYRLIGGTDDSNWQEVVIPSDASGLLLNQSVPQTVINGAPYFDQGLVSNTDIVASGSMTSTTYYVVDGNSYITTDINNHLTFTDPEAGTVTLAELVGSGSIDHSALVNLEWSVAGHTIDTDLNVGANPIILSEITTPTNPDPSGLKIYAKASGSITKLHTLDSNGNETVIGSSSVDSVFGRTGSVVGEAGDYTWDQIDKATSSIGDITTKSHTLLDDVGSNTHTDIDAHIDSASIAVHSAASNLVFNTGDQSIDGVKTFVSPPECSVTATTSYQLVNLELLNTIAQGLIPKAAVLAGTTENITLSGLQTVDTLPLASGYRVLVKDQSNTAENGIYIASPGAWYRSSDYDQTTEVKQGTFTIVLEGNQNANSQWVQYNIDPTIDVDPILFRPLPQIEVYTAASGVKKYINEFSLALYNGDSGLEILASGVRVATDGIAIRVGASGLYIDAASITNEMLAGSIENGKLNQISASDKVLGAAITSLSSLPPSAGIVPVTNLASGVPDGTKYLRDDGTWHTPTGGSSSSGVMEIVAGSNITVDATDPAAPIVSATFSQSTPYAETPSGDINGVNTSFTLAHTPAYPSGVIVVIDGVTQYNNIDYTVSGSTIDFTYAPMINSTMFAYYNSLDTGVAAAFTGFGRITVSTTAPSNPSINDLWIDIA